MRRPLPGVNPGAEITLAGFHKGGRCGAHLIDTDAAIPLRQKEPLSPIRKTVSSIAMEIGTPGVCVTVVQRHQAALTVQNDVLCKRVGDIAG